MVERILLELIEDEHEAASGGQMAGGEVLTERRHFVAQDSVLHLVVKCLIAGGGAIQSERDGLFDSSQRVRLPTAERPQVGGTALGAAEFTQHSGEDDGEDVLAGAEAG